MEERLVVVDGQVDSKDPGAARLGNFINYYSFNPAENRVKHLPKDLLRKTGSEDPILCLDIGSNSGVSTFFRKKQ